MAQNWGWLDEVGSYPAVPTVQGSLWGGLPVAKGVMPGWPIPLEFGFHSWSKWVGGVDRKEGHPGEVCGSHHVGADFSLC